MKKVYRRLGVVGGVLLLILAATVQRIDRTPLQETTHYRAWQAWIDEKSFSEPSPSISETYTLQVGWAKINITPDRTLPMAGYGNRWGAHFQRIHDSLYVRAISVEMGAEVVTLVSADLLIIPPNVTERLHMLLAENNMDPDQIYLGATHTHHGMGGWGKKIAGRIFAGKFDAAVEEMLASKIRDAIWLSRSRLAPASALTYQETPVPEGIRNRLQNIENPTVDPKLRSLRLIRRSDSAEAVLVVYGAHSTTLRRDSLYLSRDYPGHLIDALEGENNIEFAAFMAGAVGSMGFRSDHEDPEQRARDLGFQLAEALRRAPSGEPIAQPVLRAEWIPVPIPPQTARISQNWALKPWVFNALFGQSSGDIHLARVGKTVFLGMPADFSGEIMVELDRYASTKGLDLVITSFNGYYTGYITHDRHYERDLYETRTMSWNGYGAGDYYTEVAKDLIDKMAAF